MKHPRMRAFSYACTLPVTWRRWRTHHSMRRSHANFMTLCFIEPQLLTSEDCGNRDFRLCLLLWPWLRPADFYILDPYSLEIYRMCNELPTSRLSNL